MKLLYCPACQHVFSLGFTTRSCDCGRVKGAYIDNRRSWNNGRGVSVALGSGAFFQAITLATSMERADPNTSREEYQSGAKITYAWCRPNAGPGNPHSEIRDEG